MACRWHENERAVAAADDLPSVVVQLHVMEPAEQYPAVDVGSAVVGGDVVDVVGLAVRRGHAASFGDASAVANGQRDPLLRREQALFVSDIERVAATVDGDGHGSVHADVAVDD